MNINTHFAFWFFDRIVKRDEGHQLSSNHDRTHCSFLQFLRRGFSISQKPGVHSLFARGLFSCLGENKLAWRMLCVAVAWLEHFGAVGAFWHDGRGFEKVQPLGGVGLGQFRTVEEGSPEIFASKQCQRI